MSAVRTPLQRPPRNDDGAESSSLLNAGTAPEIRAAIDRSRHSPKQRDRWHITLISVLALFTFARTVSVTVTRFDDCPQKGCPA